MVKKVKLAIAGVSGYTGRELLRYLRSHPELASLTLLSRGGAGESLAALHPEFASTSLGEAMILPATPEELIGSGAHFAILALPHGVSQAWVPKLLKAGIKVVDLSADFRLHSATEFENYYSTEHTCPEFLARAVYALPDLRAEVVARADLAANPGCYPTAILLAILPLLEEGLVDAEGIYAACISGVSGAGKSLKHDLLFCQRAESVKAYGTPQHRHLGEILQELKIVSGGRGTVSFVPHLAPFKRGMTASIFLKPSSDLLQEKIAEKILAKIRSAYSRRYANSPFVRLRGSVVPPDTAHVSRSAYADIAWFYDEDAKSILLCSAIDNLGKGAATQAIENFNLMAGFAQDTGLTK